MGGLPELLGVQRMVSMGAVLPGIGLPGVGLEGPALRFAGLQAMSKPRANARKNSALFMLIKFTPLAPCFFGVFIPQFQQQFQHLVAVVALHNDVTIFGIAPRGTFAFE